MTGHRLDGVEGATYTSCPGCDGELRVRFRAVGGEPEIRWPNDRAHPGSPPHVEVVDVEPTHCLCAPFVPAPVAAMIERDRQPELLDAAVDAW